MAAIDKLYVKNYWAYENLLRWSFAYFPKLLPFFYSINMREDEFERCKERYVVDIKEIYDRDIKRIGGRFESVSNACVYLQEYYKKICGEVPPIEQIMDEVQDIRDNAALTYTDIEANYSMAILNTPAWIDRRLKWFCPIQEVRDYLHEKCGVSPKLEWLYRLFWRGKRIFRMI
jgi:hypothetical protein